MGQGTHAWLHTKAKKDLERNRRSLFRDTILAFVGETETSVRIGT
jgi:hypothetical protein